MIIRPFLYCVVILFCAGCGPGVPRDRNLNNMVPETVHSVRAGEDLSIPGTRLWLPHPDGFVFDSVRRTLYKDGVGSIKIIYSYGLQNNDSLTDFLHNVDSTVDAGGSGIYYSRRFQMDSCPAYLCYLKSKVPGEDQLVLSWGDEAFFAAGSALFPESDTVARDSLLKRMLSLYADEQTPAGVTAAEPFTLDVSQTEFLYSASLGQIFLYTIGGKSNPYFDAGQDQFFVTKLLPGRGRPLKERAVDMLRTYAMANIKILHYTVSRVFIREEEAYELEGGIRFNDKTGKLFMVVMGGPDRTLVLSALLYEKIDQRLAEIIRIAQSLEFANTITN